MRIIVGIVMTDRDYKYIQELYKSILQNVIIYEYEIMVVVRNTDKECIKNWSGKQDVKLQLVPYYEIIRRHNIHKIAEKRNIIRKYALLNNFDYLWFIDSDISVKESCLDILLDGIKYGNVSYIPYTVRWIGFPVVGIIPGNNQIKLLKTGQNIDL